MNSKIEIKNMFLVTGRLEGDDDDTSLVVEAGSSGTAQTLFGEQLKSDEGEESEYKMVIITSISHLADAINQRVRSEEDSNNGIEMSFVLDDVSDVSEASSVKSTLTYGWDGLCVSFDGHSTCSTEDNFGEQVFMELYEGEVNVRVWSDINSEDPSDVISLEGARNESRKD